MKRMLAMLLAVLMVFGMLPAQAFATETVPEETTESITSTEGLSVKEEAMNAVAAASGTCGENLTWTLNQEGTLTISGTGDMTDYDVSDEENLLIPPWQLVQDVDIHRVVIEQGVTNIGDFAFYDETEIESVDLPTGLIRIGKDAFNDCYITNIVLPDTLEMIDDGAFASCNKLTGIIIPDSVTTLGDRAFCTIPTLASVKIGSGLTTVNGNPFANCKSLNKLEISAENKSFVLEDGILYDADKTTLICCPGSRTGDFAVPESVSTIADYAFEGCAVSGVMIPDSVTSIGKAGFRMCWNLTEVSLPEGITSLESSVFFLCDKLAGIVIPASVTSLSDSFAYCFNLQDIRFLGSAPDFLGGFTADNSYFETFADVTATAYYPAGDPTWTEEIMQDYGGDITWIPYEPELGGDGSDEIDLHETLAELTDADYLAFSAIAYEEFSTSGTVQENLSEKWNTKWSEKQNVTYAELCKYIAEWEVLTLHGLSEYNGFYAVAFTNDEDEVVIAYRGSVPPDHWFSDVWNSWDAYCDWLLNDLPIELGNNLGPQFDYALEIYNNMALSRDKSKIRVTGHSLGGAWADAVSAYSGCRGITFNAVSILDVLYKTEPEKMGKLFTGADQWNFVDHTNQHDVLAGMFEKYLSTEMKPYKAHKSNIEVENNYISAVVGAVGGFMAGGSFGAVVGCVGGAVGGSIAKSHGLDSFVLKDSGGDVKLTEVVSTFVPTKVITNYMLTENHSVDFGTSGSNEIKKGHTILTPRTAYGGSGEDAILTSVQADKLIGGKGIDELDGSWGDDTYIYYWGDNSDIIYDVSGNDTLELIGVNSKANIQISDEDPDFVDIYCDGLLIASIARKNRAWSDHSFTINSGSLTKNVTAYLQPRKYSSRINIACPVNIQILDSDETVVYTIKDGETGNFYTEYGNFYVYEEENGGYGKVLDLVEGYTVQIVGVDTGTMDISYQKVENGELIDPVEIVDVPVTDIYVAVLVEKEDGTIELADNVVPSVPMYRMYDPNSGEHFYTGSTVERDFLVSAGWHYEGVGFNFPVEGKPVYRLYEPVHGEHLYTMDEAEKAKLISWGWNDEGVAFNSAGEDEVPQYRLHNPNAKRGGYHFTGSIEERDFLISIGWINEGIGWYSCVK